jgi:hypothetical protein
MKFAMVRTTARVTDAEYLLLAMLHHFAAFMLRNTVRAVERTPLPYDNAV